MILAVCLNPAVDVTYTVDRVVPGESHRVREVVERAGGKGVNVARVVSALGESVTVCGLLGDADSALWTGLDARWTTVPGRVRRSVAVVDRDDATLFNEPGIDVSGGDWARFVRDFVELVGAAAVVVASGSLPPGVPPTAYEQLTRVARAAGAEVIVDAGGLALRHALTAAPTIVKPNRHEVEAALGEGEGVTGLLTAGAQSAVVSRGRDGLLAGRDGRRWAVRPSRPVAGNPTGAGDALAAALAIGLLRGTPWPEALRHGAAAAAAAVTAPTAGLVDPAAVAAQLAGIDVEEI